MARNKVYRNGKIYTVNDNFDVCTALVVEGDRLAYVGDEAGVEKFIGPDTEVVDLQGKVVTPGFIDSHVHAVQTGYTYSRLKTKDMSKEEILAAVAEKVKTMQPGEWLVGGHGWDNDWWENPDYPSIEELDAVSPNNPVHLARAAGGVLWCNTLVLKAAGYSGIDDPEVQAAMIINGDGKPATGCFVGPLGRKLRTVVPNTPEGDREALAALQKEYFKLGLVGFTEASTTAATLDMIDDMYAKGELKIRINSAIGQAVGSNPDPAAHAWLEKAPIIGKYDNRFNVRTVKMLVAGTFGSRTAGMYEPYCDNPGNCGTPSQTKEELYKMMEEGAAHGMQVMVHAIGDRDIDWVLDNFEQIDKKYPVLGKRHRIEHFQIVRGDSPERAKALGIIPSMQAMHAPNSYNMALRCVGPERAAVSYASGLVLRRVGIVAGGSDAPVAVSSPLSGIHASVARKNDLLEPKEGAFMDNAMSREDALRSYTIWGAYISFDEDKRGSLVPGKYADFVVMDKDLMTVEPDDILNIQIMETVLAGETVYKAQ